MKYVMILFLLFQFASLAQNSEEKSDLKKYFDEYKLEDKINV